MSAPHVEFRGSRQQELLDLLNLGVDRFGECIHRLHTSYLPNFNVVNPLREGSLNGVDAPSRIIGSRLCVNICFVLALSAVVIAASSSANFLSTNTLLGPKPWFGWSDSSLSPRLLDRRSLRSRDFEGRRLEDRGVRGGVSPL